MLSSIKSITVNYDAVNEGKTFSSGDVVSGRVLLVLSKETKIEGLRVKMKGKAEVRWSEKHGDKTRYYSSKEEYFKLEQLVTGQEKGNDVVLAAGSHVFPFTFQIPQGNMPSSFKGAHGKVEYKLEAKLSRSWRLPSNAASEFTFVSKPEMGVAHLMSPQHGTVTKKMNLFTSGNAAINVNMERTAYWPGEELRVTVDIQNSSSRNLAPKLAVDQILSFSAEGRAKVCTHRVLKHVGEPIPANMPQTLILVLKLPPNLPASIPNCRIIRVEYFLKVYLDVPLASDPEVKLPLVILPAELSTGAFPYQTALGGFPYQIAPGAAPPIPGPGGFPYQPAPGAAPPIIAPGGFPYQPAPGAAPPPTAPGGFPYQPAPGSAPPPTAPGGFPYQPAPGSAPPPTVPGGFPYQPAPGSAPPPAAPGAFPYQPAPGSAPPPAAPGGFPYQPAPGSAPPPAAPGGFPYQPAPGSAPPPTAPGGFPYQSAPGSAPPPTAPGAFPYQSPPGEPYTFLSYCSPDAPPAYDILGQHSPQSVPSAPPSYSDAIKCPPLNAPGSSPPPTAPGSSPPQMPQGTYPLQDAPDSTLDTFKSLKIN
ncbi:tyrosine-protein phosphatase non-receptor type 23-like isoform X6 [Brienomyrus brachyistius]|uniref:tyrosine-protein phosphatase non-receptor type 23-like isoform X6 n=1 Tax=Brienomyrus brachyistius TaxID=42636 RepID=UPI0020B44586|nr:tyrosine-protein phosphatase non-receptor type 23-like isoform X6 [Brienomyrus brachyistius]